MEDKSYQLIQQLMELQGISGQEGRVRAFLKEQLTPLVDQVHQSPLGNIFGIKYSNVENAPKIMIAAHMDEVGFMVHQIQSNGLLKVVPIGGWNPYSVSSQRFTLQTRKGDYVCVSSSVAPHLLRGNQTQSTLKPEDILFDAGFESKEEAQSYGVRPGDAIVPFSETVKTANGKNIIGKAWDNRYGCAIVIETLQAIAEMSLPSTIIAGATVQEEVGLRGIPGAIHYFKPDICLVVDCSPAGDTQENGDAEGRLGDGFLVRVHDPRWISHTGVREWMVDTAENHDIKYQYYFSKGGTDAVAAQVMNDGIPTGVIGVAGRYIHGHQSLFNISDYQSAKAVLYQMVTEFDAARLQQIKEKV